MTDQRMPGEKASGCWNEPGNCPRTSRILATAFSDMDAAVPVNTGAILKVRDQNRGIRHSWRPRVKNAGWSSSIVQRERDQLLKEKMSCCTI